MEFEARTHSAGEVLDAALDLVRGHAVVLIGLAALVHVPIALLLPAVDSAQASADPIAALRGAAPALLYALLVSPILGIALIAALGELTRGRAARFGAALRSGVALLVPVVWASTLVLGLALLACLPLVVVAALGPQLPGLVRVLAIAAGAVLPLLVALRFLLLGQVVVIEGARGVGALRRSAELVRGSVPRCFGILLLGALITGALGAGVRLALGWLPVAGELLVGIAQSVGLAYTTALGVVLYLDQRARRGEPPLGQPLSGA